jgi:glycosyltransferase involved in cell wall biosynthesis
MALIEAMAMELPVVSTNCDGVLDIVVDGVTGTYVHPGRPEELAAGLRHIIDHPEAGRQMGRAGRRRVLELFDRRAHLERIEEIYAELLPR